MSMEERVAKIEAVLPTIATKADLAHLRVELHQSLTAMARRVVGWTIGWMTALVVITYYIANGTPESPPPPTPIVIQLPAAPSPQATPAPPVNQ